MRNAIRGAAAAAGLIVAAGTLQLATSTPAAAADGQRCLKILDGFNYKIGPKVKSACLSATDAFPSGFPDSGRCEAYLVSLGVRPNHALAACWN